MYKQTQSKRQTAEILGILRNTVKKLLQLREPPEYRRMVYHSKIDPYKEKMKGKHFEELKTYYTKLSSIQRPH